MGNWVGGNYTVLYWFEYKTPKTFIDSQVGAIKTMIYTIMGHHKLIYVSASGADHRPCPALRWKYLWQVV